MRLADEIERLVSEGLSGDGWTKTMMERDEALFDRILDSPMSYPFNQMLLRLRAFDRAAPRIVAVLRAAEATCDRSLSTEGVIRSLDALRRALEDCDGC